MYEPASLWSGNHKGNLMPRRCPGDVTTLRDCCQVTAFWMKKSIENVDYQRRWSRPSLIAGSGYHAASGRRETRQRTEAKQKALSRIQEKGKIPKIERYAKQKRLSPDPFPVARRSNSDRQSGSSPGFGSSRPDAFPCSRTVAYVGRSPSQWRDRAGL